MLCYVANAIPLKRPIIFDYNRIHESKKGAKTTPNKRRRRPERSEDGKGGETRREQSGRRAQRPHILKIKTCYEQENNILITGNSIIAKLQ